jgi:hypothetical protein
MEMKVSLTPLDYISIFQALIVYSETLQFLLSLLPSPSSLPNHPNTQGNTPLHWTALNHHLPCLKLLVNAGADPSIVNKAGMDAVFEAERRIQGNGDSEGDEKGRKCVEFLLGWKGAGGLERGVRGNGGEMEEDGEDDMNGEKERDGAVGG